MNREVKTQSLKDIRKAKFKPMMDFKNRTWKPLYDEGVELDEHGDPIGYKETRFNRIHHYKPIGYAVDHLGDPIEGTAFALFCNDDYILRAIVGTNKKQKHVAVYIDVANSADYGHLYYNEVPLKKGDDFIEFARKDAIDYIKSMPITK